MNTLFLYSIQRLVGILVIRRLTRIQNNCCDCEVNTQIVFEEMNEEQKSQAQHQLLINIADFLFSTKKTIQSLMQHKIYDKVVDGVEYRFIKHRHFIRLIKRAGFSLNYNDEMCIKSLIPSVIKGSVDITKLEKLLNSLGIEDEKPISTKHLDYSKLSGPVIRIFNKINHDMNDQKIVELEDFLGRSNLETIEMITRSKTEHIEVIKSLKLRDIFRYKGIINFGQDLEDEFIEFVSIQDDSLIPIRKFK